MCVCMCIHVEISYRMFVQFISSFERKIATGKPLRNEFYSASNYARTSKTLHLQFQPLFRGKKKVSNFLVIFERERKREKERVVNIQQMVLF